MPSIYLKDTIETFSNLRFSEFKIFFISSVLWELHFRCLFLKSQKAFSVSLSYYLAKFGGRRLYDKGNLMKCSSRLSRKHSPKHSSSSSLRYYLFSVPLPPSTAQIFKDCFFQVFQDGILRFIYYPFVFPALLNKIAFKHQIKFKASLSQVFYRIYVLKSYEIHRAIPVLQTFLTRKNTIVSVLL